MTPTRWRTARCAAATAGAGLLAAAMLAAFGAPAMAQPFENGQIPLDSSAGPLDATQGARNAPVAPPADEGITKSDNITLLANLPKQGPFNATAALNTDLAFTGDYAIAGNYEGFAIYDISTPSAPTIVSQVQCPGAQNDVAVSGNLLILSTDSSRNNDSCENVAQPATVKESWEGIKIFDISDKANPRYVSAVETACGSHTHTLAPSRTENAVYVYVSSYSPSATLPDCQPPHDLISIVKVPLDAPDSAALVGTPVLFPDGGNPGNTLAYPDTEVPTSGCHDLTVYAEKDLMAGACMGDGVLFDITDREHPTTIHSVQDSANFSFWHSATFNNAGNKVVFTDELGGGGAATCNEQIGPLRGADAIYDIVGEGAERKLEFRSYYKISRPQTDTENCVAHNGSLIPVAGRDIMVQAWYQGGLSVWDFTDSANPVELAFFDRGPFDATTLVAGGPWSTYYYNGHIYSSEIQRGLDVFDLTDPATDPAKSVRFPELNVQTQGSFPS